MQVSYGSPGHRGVTSLMAVSDVESDYATAATKALSTGTAIAGAALGLGLLTGSRTLRNLAAGATLALLAVRAAARR